MRFSLSDNTVVSTVQAVRTRYQSTVASWKGAIPTEDVAQALDYFFHLSRAYFAESASIKTHETDTADSISRQHAADETRLQETKAKQIKEADDNLAAKHKDIARRVEEIKQQRAALQAQRDQAAKQYAALGFMNRQLAKREHEEFLGRCRREDSSLQHQGQTIESAAGPAQAFRDQTVADVEGDYNRAKAVIDQTRSEALAELADTVRAETQRVQEQTRSCLGDVLRPEQFHQLRRHIESITPAVADYRPIEHSDTFRPPVFHLGELGRRILAGDERRSFIENAMKEEFDAIVLADDADRVIARLPLAVDLADGFCAMITPAAGDDKDSDAAEAAEGGNAWVNQLVRHFLLRAFVAYPPGKLEAVMIDPIAQGLSFDGFTGLVDKKHESVIDGQIWTRPEDIAKAMATLNSKIATASQQYGRDRASYFAREPVRVLAINDFPRGFSKEAISNLANIVRNSEAFGVVVLIGVNPSFESSFEKNNDYHSILADPSLVRLHGASPDRLWVDQSDDWLTVDASDRRALDAKGKALIATLREGISKAQGRVEGFDQLFDDIEDESTWCRRDSLESVTIPIGVFGAGLHEEIVIGRGGGSTEHHGLIAGSTGAGKSTLLHTMIMSVLLNYPPDEVKLALIDFKEGVEFRKYAAYRIPNFHSITVNSEPEFALTALRDLERVFHDRLKTFQNRAEYRERTGRNIPLLLVLFDEVQELFSNDRLDSNVVKECVGIVKTLVLQGRAVGIHLFLASQNFERVAAIRSLFTDMKVRVLIKDAENGGIIDDDDALGELANQPSGSAIINVRGGARGGNRVFQVCRLPEDEHDALLQALADRYASPAYRDLYGGEPTKLLFTSLQDSRYHQFNAFVETGRTVSLVDADQLGLIIGNRFDIGESLVVNLERGPRENLLVIGQNEDMAKSVFATIALSVLYEELNQPAANLEDELIRVFDLSTESSTEAGSLSDLDEDVLRHTTSLKNIGQLFNRQVRLISTSGRQSRFGANPVVAEITDLHDRLKRRMDGADPATERLITLFFGINRASVLNQVDVQVGGAFGEATPLEKLQFILQHGPEFNMPVVMWGSTLASSERVLNANAVLKAPEYFNARIVFGGSGEDVAHLVNDPRETELSPSAAAYQNRLDGGDAIHFRPYSTPPLAWTREFAAAYEDHTAQAGG
jgi:hypothetical protein